VLPSGDTVIRPATFSRLAAKHKLTAWVHLLAATASHSGRTLTVASVGKDRGPATFTLPPIEAATATAHLADLVALRDEALTEPLPLYCATSHAFANAARAGATDLVERAGKEWTSADFGGWDKEDKDDEHLLVLRGQVPIEDVCGDFRFQILARRLWDPILDHARRPAP
jgi:exodeoxyribonuclease V gamma subunit